MQCWPEHGVVVPSNRSPEPALTRGCVRTLGTYALLYVVFSHPLGWKYAANVIFIVFLFAMLLEIVGATERLGASRLVAREANTLVCFLVLAEITLEVLPNPARFPLTLITHEILGRGIRGGFSETV